MTVIKVSVCRPQLLLDLHTTIRKLMVTPSIYVQLIQVFCAFPYTVFTSSTFFIIVQQLMMALFSLVSSPSQDPRMEPNHLSKPYQFVIFSLIYKWFSQCWGKSVLANRRLYYLSHLSLDDNRKLNQFISSRASTTAIK